MKSHKWLLLIGYCLVFALVANSFSPNQLVLSGKTLYIRLYPWCKDVSKEQVLMLGGLTIKGITN